MNFFKIFNFNKIFTNKILERGVSRLVNRYTTSGVVIVLSQLEALNVLPKGTLDLVDGVPGSSLIVYVLLAIAIYFIFHKPEDKSKDKIEKLEKELRLKELTIQNIEVSKKLKKLDNKK